MIQNSLAQQLLDTATAFRLGKEAEASGRLKDCIEQMQARLEQQQLPSEALQLVPGMVASQQRHDWLGLADTLEYELVPLLA
ncbi:hypothetical protein [Shewanella algae]|uniref:hypothetical protein n=1 Tax=Shewanella algae TaxID=38313 RepID=UPI001AAD39DA|nr:hypothetical protein [Shewanella algae]MBO2670179.1 hypothetical protein [Shewanella algae]